MGIAKLYSQSGGSGFKINGIIQDYYAYAGENISAGDFVEFVNGVASSTTETSTATAIDNTNTYSGYKILAVELSENRVFIAHSYGSNYYLYGVVCTVDGATITYGTDTLLSNASSFAMSAQLLQNGDIFIAHARSTSYDLYGIVVSVNGTTITSGTDTKGTGSYVTAVSTELLSNGKIFISYTNNSSYHLCGRVVTISGMTIEWGTHTSLLASSYAGFSISTCLLQNGNVFIAHSYNSSNFYLYGIVCTILGTTITAGSDTALNTTTARTGEKISTTLLPNGNVFIANSYSTSYYLYGTVCSFSGTTITKGANTQISANTYAGFAFSAVTLQNGDVFIACCTDSSNFLLYGIVCTVSNTTITAGTATQLNADRYTGYTLSAITLNNGTVFVAHDYSSNHYLYAQIFGVSNNIPTNNVTITEYETQVRKATTSDIYGVAKTSGMGAYKVVDYTIPEGENVSKGENREYSVETLIQGDKIPKTWAVVTAGTEYVAEDGTKLTLNGTPSSGNVSYACDGNVETSFSFSSSVDADTIIEFPKPIKVSKMKLCMAQPGLSGNPVISVWGSDNGNDWVSLFRESAQYTSLTEVTLSTNSYYTHYRARINGSTSIAKKIYEIQVSEYTEVFSYTGTALQSGTAGDTIQIAVPVSDEESTGHNDIVSVYKPPYSIYNLIINGDFSNGLEGWTPEYLSDGAVLYTATLESDSEGNYVKVVHTTAYSANSRGFIRSTRFPTYINHIYYICGTVKCGANNTTSANRPSLTAGNIDTGSSVRGTSYKSEWHFISTRFTRTKDVAKDSLILDSYFDVDADVGSEYYYRNVKEYDLTEMFGAGNEPTQEWCDNNL